MTKSPFKHITYLSLGSNLGDRMAHLQYAVSEMNHFGSVKSLSSIYETESWGYHDPATYLNMACRFDTDIEPQLLREKMSDIEKRRGRILPTSYQKYAARTLDIDILLIDGLTIHTPELVVPHPRMTVRRFVLEPLSEIAPDLLHPISGLPMKNLLQLTTDKSSIVLYRNEL